MGERLRGQRWCGALLLNGMLPSLLRRRLRKINAVCQIPPMPYPSLKFLRLRFLLSLGTCSLLLGSAVQGEEPPIQLKESPVQLKEPPVQAKEPPVQVMVPPVQVQEPPGKARALLDEVQKSEQDREIAAKQTEIDRLKEDQAKIEQDSTGLKKTLDSTSGLVTDTNNHLATLTTDSRRLQHELAISEAWTSAEQLKIAGLQALTDAQGKSLSALTRRAEAAEARSHVLAAEMEILQGGKQVPAEGREKSQPDLGKARKALAIAEAKLQAEERSAYEAMKAATAKMALAEAKADMAQRLADNDLTLEPAVVTKSKPKAAAKPAEKLAPVAAPPPKTAGNPKAPAKSAPTAGWSKTRKAPATSNP